MVQGVSDMTDDTEVLLAFVHEHWEEMRHAENQRSTITNIIIVIASLIIGLISQVGLAKGSIVLTLLLAVLGIYGVLITAKLYERHQFSQKRLDYWYTRIDELHPNAQFLSLRQKADDAHAKEFPKLVKFRVHRLWIALHSAIALLGIGLTAYILLCP